MATICYTSTGNCYHAFYLLVVQESVSYFGLLGCVQHRLTTVSAGVFSSTCILATSGRRGYRPLFYLLVAYNEHEGRAFNVLRPTRVCATPALATYSKPK